MFFMPWSLGAAHGCVWFFGACFVLVCLVLLFCCGVGLGLVWFSGLCANVLWGSGWLFWLVGVSGLLVLFGEFDPGSGRTLAACLTHASRTVKRFPFWLVWMSGERVSNT